MIKWLVIFSVVLGLFYFYSYSFIDATECSYIHKTDGIWYRQDSFYRHDGSYHYRGIGWSEWPEVLLTFELSDKQRQKEWNDYNKKNVWAVRVLCCQQEVGGE